MRKKLFSILALLLTVNGAWADDNITVYFTDASSWGYVHVHYWGGQSSTIFPGKPMTWVGKNEYNQDVYGWEIPANTTGIVFNGGSDDKKTGDITTNIADDGWWYYSNNTTEYSGKHDAYYVVCSNNSWTVDLNNKLKINTISSGEYYIHNLALTTGTGIKVVSSKDNGQNVGWYPSGTGNEYSIPIDATYSIYFKPNKDGGSDWHYNYFYAKPTAVTLDEACTNNSTILGNLNGKTVNVTLKRTLKANGWNTFCVPFELTSKPDGWSKVKYLTSSSYLNNELTLNFADVNFSNGSILPGRPYLVKVDADVVNPTFNNAVVNIGIYPNETTYANFVPVMSPTELTAGDKNVLFISEGKYLTYPSATGNIDGFRAYFKLNNNVSGARAFTMSFDDDATGITTVLSDETTAGSGTYTLDGRRIEGKPTQKGVYIVNGKKTVIK